MLDNQFTQVTCGNCGRILDEPSSLSKVERKPCPDCGSISRKFGLFITDHLGAYDQMKNEGNLIGKKSTDVLSHVFISYVHENQEQVDKLCEEIAKHGVKIWLDKKDIPAGSRWKGEIREAIRTGAFFIACFSKEYYNRSRTYMNEELTLAIEELRLRPTDRIWFIPVLLSECDIPVRSIGGGETLLDIQWVPLYENWNAGIKRIVDVIQPVPLEVQYLIEVLSTGRMEIAIIAAEELGRIGHTKAVQPLIKALINNKFTGRMKWGNFLDDYTLAIATALAKIGEPSISSSQFNKQHKTVSILNLLTEKITKHS